jgi:carboxypeptidase family protein
MSQNKLRLAAACVMGVALLAGACGGDGDSKAPAGPPPDARRVDVSKAGRVSGRVLLDGALPPNAEIKMGADPICKRANESGAAVENYVGKDGGLGNVFVYVKDGLGGYWFDTPSQPVKLDQTGCRYVPHVIGVQTRQDIEIVNSDGTLHNVHALAEHNRDFNFGQHITGQKHTRSFANPEVMIRIKCDVHSWMNAYVGVVAHPYFAVTPADGAFALKDLPAGTYTVEAWHEKLGTRTQTVTIGEKETKEISFTFKAPAASAN